MRPLDGTGVDTMIPVAVRGITGDTSTSGDTGVTGVSEGEAGGRASVGVLEGVVIGDTGATGASEDVVGDERLVVAVAGVIIGVTGTNWACTLFRLGTFCTKLGGIGVDEDV